MSDLKMNVILIDDEPISLLLLKDLFSDYTNVRVYEETSYQKAYQRLLTPIVFDILISDIYLGLASGLDLLTQAKSANLVTYTSSIFMSSQTSKDLVIRGAQLGIQQFIVKPFNLELVRRQLQEILNTWNTQRKKMIEYFKSHPFEVFNDISKSISEHLELAIQGENRLPAIKSVGKNFSELRLTRCAYQCSRIELYLNTAKVDENVLADALSDLKEQVNLYFPHSIV